MLTRILLIIALIAWPILAIADGCTSMTIIDQHTGTMRFCQQCCYGGHCTLTCL